MTEATLPRAAVVVALVAALLAGPVAGTAVAAPPQPPAAYYGQVTLNGEPAPAGLTVAAHFQGGVADTLTTSADGSFGGPGAFDSKLTVPGNASTDGDAVTFTVNGHATDARVDWSSGANDAVTLHVTDSQAPSATLTNPVTGDVSAGTTVTFDASASTDDFGVASYAWTLPDGSPATGATASYTFSQPGEHAVSVVVTDVAGNTASAQTTVTVAAANSGGHGHHGHSSGNTGNAGNTGTTGSESNTGNASNASSGNASAPKPGHVSLSVSANRTSAHVANASANSTTEIAMPETNQTATGNASLTGMNVSVNRSESFDLNVSVSDSAPGNASGGNDVLSYISVDHSVPDSSVSGVDFRFTVSADRMAELNASTDHVVLYRHHGGSWHRLSTRYLGSSNGTATFVAHSPGLSLYAVRSGNPDLAVSDASLASSTATVGDTASVSVTVANDGSGAGEKRIAVTANDATVASKTVSVDPDGSKTVTLSFTPDTAGTYDVTVNGTSAGTLTVTAAQTATTTTGGTTGSNANAAGTPSTPREQSGFDPTAVGVTVFVAAVVVALFALARRRV